MAKECSGCGRPKVQARGLCPSCYSRAWKAGELPTVPRSNLAPVADPERWAAAVATADEFVWAVSVGLASHALSALAETIEDLPPTWPPPQ